MYKKLLLIWTASSHFAYAEIAHIKENLAQPLKDMAMTLNALEILLGETFAKTEAMYLESHQTSTALASLPHSLASSMSEAVVRSNMFTVPLDYPFSGQEAQTIVTGSGSVQSSSGVALLQTGTTASSTARLVTTQYLPVATGHEGFVTFSAQFTDTHSNTQQWVGAFDDINGCAIGLDGTQLAVLVRENGSDTITHQANFNANTLSSGSIGYQSNRPSLLRIAYEPLRIKFQISSQSNQWITFHTLESNSTQRFNFLRTLPIAAAVDNQSTNNNVQLYTGHWCAGVTGPPAVHRRRSFSAERSKFRIQSKVENHVLTIRNKPTFHAQPNRVITRISSFSGGAARSTSEVMLLRMRKAATVSNLDFSDVDTSNSVMEVSTDGTYQADSGTTVLAAPANHEGTGPIFQMLAQKDIIINLLPGESLTVTAQGLTGGRADFFSTISWEEQF